MPAIKYALLGLVQGLTEFLPVSSSGHLVFFQDLLNIRDNQVLLDVVLHLGTLLAVVVFLFKDIRQMMKPRILYYLLVSTAVTAGVVFPFRDFFESLFLSRDAVAAALLVTALVLFCTKRFPVGVRSMDSLKFRDGLWLGIAQGFAVIPGLSRSGLTISALLFRGMEKEVAFKVSFLMFVPAILGALFLKVKDFSGVCAGEFNCMLLGFFTAFLSGLLALKMLLAVMRRARLHMFGYYCVVMAVLIYILK